MSESKETGTGMSAEDLYRSGLSYYWDGEADATNYEKVYRCFKESAEMG